MHPTDYVLLAVIAVGLIWIARCVVRCIRIEISARRRHRELWEWYDRYVEGSATWSDLP